MNNQYYNPWAMYQSQQYGQIPQSQPIQPQQPMQQTSTDDRIWVSSKSAAESYMLPANSFVRLWDSTQPCYYEKQTDPQGKPFPLQVYEYKLKQATVTTAPTQTVDFSEKIDSLEKRIAELESARKGDDES